jgi:transcriptional regulator with XRE-family HTH domain
VRRSEHELSVGERVAYYRRRRGLSQVALAELVGRTESWIEKIEHGRAALDRISVVRELARVLDVSLQELLPDDLDRVEPRGSSRSVSALRDLVLSYRAVNPRFALLDGDLAVPSQIELQAMVDDVWTAYQDSRFGYAITRLNRALPLAYLASQHGDVDAHRSLAYLYHVAASVLVKLGNLDLARVCADRGDIAAQATEDPITVTALQRCIAHTLLSNGQYADAAAVVREGVLGATKLIDGPDPSGLSVTGTLMLVGAIASARADERAEAAAFLRHAERLADRIGRDRNDVWTAFGPTNVAIHRVTVAADLGYVQQAIELGSALDVSTVPRERQARHQLEVARALSRVARRDEALHIVLSAERSAPDQVRRHFLTHELVDTWMRTTRTRMDADLVALARRLGHAA